MPRTGPDLSGARGSRRDELELPRPTLRFRLRAWRDFQHALDPLAAPKPLPIRPQRH